MNERKSAPKAKTKSQVVESPHKASVGPRDTTSSRGSLNQRNQDIRKGVEKTNSLLELQNFLNQSLNVTGSKLKDDSLRASEVSESSRSMGSQNEE